MSPLTEVNKSKPVGILGGGQLSRMLVEAAQRIGLNAIPFCGSKDDPAAQVARDFVVGQIDDAKAIGEFFARVGVVAFESDFLPFESLRKFSQADFVPALAVLERLSDKLQQKELLAKLQIPTSKFEKFPGGKLDEWVVWAVNRLGGNAVFKWAKGGYDGKGVFIFSGDFSRAIKFCESAVQRGVNIFAEEKISFVRELAQLTVFSINGELAYYPLVISEQHSGICDRVIGPAVVCGVDARLEAEARTAAEKIANELKLYGTFAIEFFETKDGRILVNELAPRVHNSGHFSIDAAECSQFENHWRALTGMKLGGTKTAPGFAMQNLISPSDVAASNISKLAISSGSFHLYWYGKAEPRSGRKMGHINLVASSAQDLEENLPYLAELKREWLSRFETNGGEVKDV